MCVCKSLLCIVMLMIQCHSVSWFQLLYEHLQLFKVRTFVAFLLLQTEYLRLSPLAPLKCDSYF